MTDSIAEPTDNGSVEQEATPDEAFDLGKVAGWDEGWDECSQQIVRWLRQMDGAAPMWEWAGSFADEIQRLFVEAPKYVETGRPSGDV